MTLRHAACALALAALPAASPAAHGEPFSIPRWTVDGGGMGLGQSGAYFVGGTLGQPDAGRLRAGLTVLNGGFWLPNGATPVSVPSEPPPAGTTRDAIFATTPNPFAGTTRVSFALSTPGRVDARVFDVRGALVRTLESGELGAGTHERVWDARDDAGGRVRPGIYLLRVRIPSQHAVQKLVILR